MLNYYRDIAIRYPKLIGVTNEEENVKLQFETITFAFKDATEASIEEMKLDYRVYISLTSLLPSSFVPLKNLVDTKYALGYLWDHNDGNPYYRWAEIKVLLKEEQITALFAYSTAGDRNAYIIEDEAFSRLDALGLSKGIADVVTSLLNLIGGRGGMVWLTKDLKAHLSGDYSNTSSVGNLDRGCNSFSMGIAPGV